MKNFLVSLLVASCLFFVGTAEAHGDGKPEHGGILQMVDDLSFELVVKGDLAEVYLGDHGEKVMSAGKCGKLTILSGTNKVEVKLEAGGDNKMLAKGVKISKGDKVIALIISSDNKTTSIRFVIK